MLNPGANVKMGNQENLCAFFNLQAKETIDAEVCTQWQVDAATAGCKCGISGEPTNAGGSMSISMWSIASALAVTVATILGCVESFTGENCKINNSSNKYRKELIDQ